MEFQLSPYYRKSQNFVGLPYTPIGLVWLSYGAYSSRSIATFKASQSFISLKIYEYIYILKYIYI